MAQADLSQRQHDRDTGLFQVIYYQAVSVFVENMGAISCQKCGSVIILPANSRLPVVLDVALGREKGLLLT